MSTLPSRINLLLIPLLFIHPLGGFFRVQISSIFIFTLFQLSLVKIL